MICPKCGAQMQSFIDTESGGYYRCSECGCVIEREEDEDGW